MSHDKYYLRNQAIRIIKDKLDDERLSDNNREMWSMVLSRIQIASPVNSQIVGLLIEMLPAYAWD